LGGLVEVGPERPAHGFPETARGRLVADVVRHVDDDQTFRYRDASGDTNPIHVDEAYAKEAKLPGIIVHGLCTMAMCGSVVVDEVAGGDPARLARLAVRFSRPVVPGDDLTVSVYDAGDGAYAFEAKAREKLVVRDGWAEVRS
jgi:acyl dehydratase